MRREICEEIVLLFLRDGEWGVDMGMMMGTGCYVQCLMIKIVRNTLVFCKHFVFYITLH